MQLPTAFIAVILTNFFEVNNNYYNTRASTVNESWVVFYKHPENLYI